MPPAATEPVPPTRDDADGDAAWMTEALRLAHAAGALGNVPIGAVVVRDGQAIARSGNLRDTLQDPTAHAELLALRTAAQTLGSWRLEGATLYVTVEPCAMCAGAIGQARVGRLVYGVAEPKTGAVNSTAMLLEGAATRVTDGVLAEACRSALTEFFASVRAAR